MDEKTPGTDSDAKKDQTPAAVSDAPKDQTPGAIGNAPKDQTPGATGNASKDQASGAESDASKVPTPTQVEGVEQPPQVPKQVVEAVVEAVRSAPDLESAVPGHILTQEEWDHLSKRDQRLLRGIFERIARRETLARDPDELSEARTFGQRLADQIAAFGGSWPFILLFFAFLAGWVGVNVVLLGGDRAFDPYPFVFLNLMLSMLAAVQAPVIMMSQNRQTLRDRLAAENDYAVNLRAEVEIRALHDKMDELREAQWVALVAQQQEQIRLLEKLCGPIGEDASDKSK